MSVMKMKLIKELKRLGKMPESEDGHFWEITRVRGWAGSLSWYLRWMGDLEDRPDYGQGEMKALEFASYDSLTNCLRKGFTIDRFNNVDYHILTPKFEDW